MNLPWRRRQLTEKELLDQISCSLHVIYTPTSMWLYLLCLIAIAILSYRFGFR